MKAFLAAAESRRAHGKQWPAATAPRRAVCSGRSIAWWRQWQSLVGRFGGLETAFHVGLVCSLVGHPPPACRAHLRPSLHSSPHAYPPQPTLSPSSAVGWRSAAFSCPPLQRAHHVTNLAGAVADGCTVAACLAQDLDFSALLDTSRHVSAPLGTEECPSVHEVRQVDPPLREVHTVRVS